MSAAGIIFSNVHDDNLSELTRVRSLGAVPFGCRYRLIDFTLSNMVNSDITNISIVTNMNYNSLLDHIGSGKDWDLARRSGGVKFYPPNIMPLQNFYETKYETRLGALRSLVTVIENIPEEYVVLSDCDVICNINLNDVIAAHKNNGADMTVVVKKLDVDRETARRNVFVKSDNDGRINEVLVNPNEYEGDAEMVLNIIVMSRKYLYDVVCDAQVKNKTSFSLDILAEKFATEKYYTYHCDSHFACMSSLESYFKENMELIDNEAVFDELFNTENRQVFTKIRNSAPTYYSEGSSVKNSLIADGCIVEGTVENSILFRGVKVGRGATVKNSILFQDAFLDENVSVNYVIADKNVSIRNSRELSGCESLPYYIDKGKMI